MKNDPKTLTEEQADKIEMALRRHRLPFGDELACQRTVAIILEQLGIVAEREVAVSGARGRIDFYVPDVQLGIELKVKGGPSEVARQLLRYAEAPEIAGLMLVTGRARLAAGLPDTLSGKPLRVVATWRGGL